MADYIIQDTTLTNMANAIRDVWAEPSTNTMTPQMMINKIKATNILRGAPNGMTDDEPWVRPESWPDLDSLTLPALNGGDVLYLTYDLSKTEGYCDPFISVRIRAGAAGTAYIKRGHISNNEFVADETNSLSIGNTNAGTFSQDLDPNNGNIQLWQITATFPITRIGFTPPSDKQLENMIQPCVEKYGRLDNITYIGGSISVSGANDYTWGTFWVEREKIYMGGLKVCTTLGNVWSYCYSLKSLDVTNWDTSTWTNTTCQSMFNGCTSLREIDLSHWDTSKWTVTSTSYMFNNCTSLRHIDLSSWKTSNWAVTKTEYMFAQCISLLTVDISTWNTSNWVVTNLGYMFSRCMSLTEIDMDNWDTSNWEVTTLANMCYYCTSLRKVKIGKWDTNNWEVTTIGYIFFNCCALEEIDLSEWDTSNWKLTNLSSWFSGCSSLQELDLSDWDTTGWKPTSMSSTFSSMEGLKKLDISGWDTSGWTTLTSLSSPFSSNYVREIYFPADFLCNSNYNNSFSFNSNPFLKITNGYPYKYSHTYSSYLLTHDSLVATFNRLPTVTNQTITISYHNMCKVSAAEIAIATAKGWTVA